MVLIVVVACMAAIIVAVVAIVAITSPTKSKTVSYRPFFAARKQDVTDNDLSDLLGSTEGNRQAMESGGFH